VVQTPEVVRVYLGSFWEAPLKLEDNRYAAVQLLCFTMRCALPCAVVVEMMHVSVGTVRYLLMTWVGYFDVLYDMPYKGHRMRLVTSSFVPLLVVGSFVCHSRYAVVQLLFYPALYLYLPRPHRALLEREKADLLQEMMSLPQNAVVRRINELVKRARAVKVHAYIVHYLKKQMPYVLGTGRFECLHLYLPGLVGTKCRWLHFFSCKVAAAYTHLCSCSLCA
jgi:hypothetical protein